MIADVILHTLKDILPEREFIALHEPYFAGDEIEYLRACVKSNFVSSIGKYVDEFEEMLQDYTGMKRAVAVVNGTAALHIALKLAGVQPGDEVLVPALAFVATANAVTYLNAVPHFVDSEERTLGIDPFKLEDYLIEISQVRSNGCYNKKTGRRIKAIVPVHTFGYPVDLDPLLEVCFRFALELVEDMAESLGSFYKGKSTGHWGKLSGVSFNGNKIITTGGGGAILTNDEKLGKLAKHITTTAKVPHKWEFYHDQIGYNYRMPNINAAIGCAQMKQLPEFLKKKRALAKRYEIGFSDIDHVRFFVEPEFSRSNYWLNAILLDSRIQNKRDAVLEKTNSNGIMARPVWRLLYKLPMYKHCSCMDMSVAESLEARLINIPSSVDL